MKGREVMRLSIMVVAAMVSLVGCAQSPDAIQPSYVSRVPFEGWSCQQLANEQQNLSQALMRASAQQEQAHRNDAAGVFLIGFPVSSMAGENIAPQIANMKGQNEAIASVITQKSCTSTHG